MTAARIARDHWSWAGIWIVGATAAVWSFSSLSNLAVLVGVTDTVEAFGVTARISWGLPITVDVLAVVASRVWLRGTAPADAVRYAQRAAWAAIAASVIGNAYHGWLAGDGRFDSVIVSAVPAFVIGALVHLAVLATRTADPATSAEVLEVPPSAEPEQDQPVDDEPEQAEPETVHDLVQRRSLTAVPAMQPTAHVDVEVEPQDRAAELIAAGAGRKKLAKELDISEYEARRLIDGTRQA